MPETVPRYVVEQLERELRQEVLGMGGGSAAQFGDPALPRRHFDEEARLTPEQIKDFVNRLKRALAAAVVP